MRTPYYHPDFPFIIMWSEKAACTPVLIWFLHHAGLLEEAMAYHRWPHNFEQQVMNRRDGYFEKLNCALAEKTKPVIQFVRCPFRRAVSSFLILPNTPAPLPDHFGHQTWRELRSFYYGDPESTEGVSFQQFLEWLHQTGVEIGQVNPHYAQQFVPESAAQVDETVRVENLSDELKALEHRFGLEPAPDTVFAKTSHSNNYSMEATPFAQEKMHPSPNVIVPHWRSFFDDQTEALVRDLYAQDFERYGYSAHL